MFGAINFLPLYQQTVQGSSATNSGLLLLPMMLGMMVVSVIAGQVITKTGRYRAFPIIGGIGMTVGFIVLSLVDMHTTKTQLALMMVVLGTGMGFLMQTTMLIAQNSVEQKDLGVASSAATFFRSIGGSFGVSLFGTLFIRKMHDDIAASSLGPAVADKITSGGARVDPSQLHLLPPNVLDGLFHGISAALAYVFVWGIPFAAIVAVLAFFIKHVPLRSGPTHEPAKQSEAEPVFAAIAD
jgi:MFS family permease